jgi:tripartite-type tricarboxylate transporter receptor subunit TctC
LARPLVKKLSEILGQNIIIENKPGANGNIAATEVARAAPDGTTFLFASSSQPIAVSVYKNLSYDLLKDFTPISLVSVSPSVLVIHPSVPAKTWQELVAVAKERPGKLNFGSSGRGGTMHLAGELFKSMTGTNIVHVAYRGAGPAITDLIGGHVEVVFVNIPPVLSAIQSGQVRALGVTTKTRSSVLPDVPSLHESGLTGFESTTWYGIIGPAGLPADIVKRWNDAIVTAMKSDEVSGPMKRLGSEPQTNTPEQFAQFIREEVDNWAKVVRAAGATGTE